MMVKEGICYSLIRAGRPLANGLVTRPIAGVDWTIDSAFISRAGSQHPALSLFAQEVRKHFRAAPEIPEKKPVVSVRVHEGNKEDGGWTAREPISTFRHPQWVK